MLLWSVWVESVCRGYSGCIRTVRGGSTKDRKTTRSYRISSPRLTLFSGSGSVVCTSSLSMLIEENSIDLSNLEETHQVYLSTDVHVAWSNRATKTLRHKIRKMPRHIGTHVRIYIHIHMHVWVCIYAPVWGLIRNSIRHHHDAKRVFAQADSAHERTNEIGLILSLSLSLCSFLLCHTLSSEKVRDRHEV